MATLRQQAIPLANYATGQRQFGPFPIPDSAKTLYFEVARCTSADPTIWPHPVDDSDPIKTRLQIDFEGSTDGVNWTPAGGVGSFGGIHVLRNGSESTKTTLIVALPDLVNRQLRINTGITDGPLRTEGFIELRD